MNTAPRPWKLLGAYASWRGMHRRCAAAKQARYYTSRGILVCERWRSFENFYADMGDRPEGLSLDRINNDGNYEPGNCAWADRTRQSRNRRGRSLVTAFGETKCVADWCEDPRCSADFSCVAQRVRNGWSHEKAVSTPPRKITKHVWGIRSKLTRCWCEGHFFTSKKKAEAFLKAQWHVEWIEMHEVAVKD